MFKICDAHNDILYVSINEEQVLNYFYHQKNLESVFCAYFSYNNSKANVFDMHNKFKLLKKLKFSKKTIENAWFITRKNLSKVLEEKPFCIALSHNENNSLCGGALDNGELTQFGGYVAKELENNNIIVDTAHMNQKSFWQFAKISKYPLFNSHSGFQELFNHKRNLTTNQIFEIKNSGGYIGLALYPKFFITKSYDSNKIVQNILWFFEKFGTKTLGFGTDFNGIDIYPTDINNYNDLQIIAEKLKNYGAKAEDIENLFSKNLLNYIKKIQ